MRASALSKDSGGTDSARKSPFESVSHTNPQGPFFFGKSTARSTASDFSGRSAESVSVPGVTIREMRRSIMPLPGGLICSTITTDSPNFTSFEM